MDNIKSKNILVTRSSLPPFNEFVEKIKPLWDTAKLTNMGELHKELESELKRYLQVDNITLFVNGHLTLELLIQAMNLTGEVITTPYTFASTTHAIIRNGLDPIFCDINKDNYTIDTNKIEQLITNRTSAILPVHVYGQVCDVNTIQEIAKRNNLKVIYDAAHAFGVKKDGVPIGNFGDASMFSFHATKVFNTIEGGAAVYHDENLNTILYQLKNFGIMSQVDVEEVGINAKMNEFQAAMGLCNLKYLDREIKRRKYLVEIYREKLKRINGIRIIPEQEGVESNYAYFPIIIESNEYGLDRDQLSKKLESYHIYPRKYFFPLISEFNCYKDKFNSNLTPIAKNISRKVLTLPLYTKLKEEEVEFICDIIGKRK